MQNQYFCHSSLSESCIKTKWGKKQQQKNPAKEKEQHTTPKRPQEVIFVHMYRIIQMPLLLHKVKNKTFGQLCL